MKSKKQFVAPRVVQVVQVRLERDLLGQSLGDEAEVIIPGIESVDTDLSDTETYDVFVD